MRLGSASGNCGHRAENDVWLVSFVTENKPSLSHAGISDGGQGFSWIESGDPALLTYTFIRCFEDRLFWVVQSG